MSLVVTIVQTFNGEPAGRGATTHTVRTLKGLARLVARRRRGDGWGVRLGARAGSASPVEVLRWIAAHLRGHEGEAMEWLDRHGILYVELETHCECGEWSGERCAWSGPESEMDTVEWMPPQHRASHTAARNAGVYPHNGARHLQVHRDCANTMLAHDGAWCSVVGGAS